MNKNIIEIQEYIAPLRAEIVNHKVYQAVKTIEDLQIFMQFHVYAVWDFMSLLKSLQQNLTCVSTPWFPTENANTRYLINEIVAGEESDIDAFGNRCSHFELFLNAMQQIGADTKAIEVFLSELKTTMNLEKAFKTAQAPKAVQEFVNYTFDVINSNKTYLQAAVFTFGREDLIPNMFVSMVDDFYQKLPESLTIYKYYLERHIEIDAEHHSHLAFEMTCQLCQNNDLLWDEAKRVVRISLEKRLVLWNGAHEAILAKNKSC